MRKIGQFCVGLLLATGAFGALTGDVPFERYQIILDRKPFGDLPVQSIVVAPSPEAESFARSLRLSTIIDMDDGSLKVGFVDTRTGKSYMMRPGDPPQDGIDVVSADWSQDEAIVRQGEVMALIKLTSGEAQAITAQDQQRRQQDQQARPNWQERRRQRQAEMEAEQARPPPEPKLTGAELEKHLQDYQMEVIRQGLPPLPIPLTEEMDRQLISEGVLPP